MINIIMNVITGVKDEVVIYSLLLAYTIAASNHHDQYYYECHNWCQGRSGYLFFIVGLYYSRFMGFFVQQ